MGCTLGPDLLMDASQLGSFNLGSATTQAQNVSVKSKKVLAQSRAHFTLVSDVEMPKCSPKSISFATISKPNNKTSERNEFLFTTSVRNELDDSCGGDDHNSSRGGTAIS